MNVASMEAMWSVYTRMVPQQTYEAILATPTRVDDIVIGELLWCASKSLVSGSAILVVAAVLGAVADWRAILALPAIFLTGFCFAAPALIMTALAKGYEFFTFYLTLVMTPMFILCGVFYPTASLPAPMQTFVQFLPLTHAVAPDQAASRRPTCDRSLAACRCSGVLWILWRLDCRSAGQASLDCMIYPPKIVVGFKLASPDPSNPNPDPWLTAPFLL